MSEVSLPFRDRLALGTQRLLGWLFFLFLAGLLVAGMRFILRYRVANLKRVRGQFKRLVGTKRAPLLVCANHLTLIDSAVIQWALASNWTYLKTFRLFAWNVPERRNFASNVYLRVVCYLLKCVPVVRRGPPQETKAILDKLRYLLASHEALFIFPEGTRSKTGRVDTENFGYGVGRLCAEVEGVRVLCVYQRGAHQERSSSLPRRKETFYTDMRLIRPRSDHKGLRAARDIATQIVATLNDMEQKYFAHPVARRQ